MDRKAKHMLILLAIIFIVATVHADQIFVGTSIENKNKLYQSHLQIGGTRLFNINSSKTALTVEFFIPFWQKTTDLVFTDLRVYDSSGKPFEVNMQLGYRHLSFERQHMYGIYGSFDRKRTMLGNYYNQLTLGAECWLTKWFIGGNLYEPIGRTTKNNDWYTQQNTGIKKYEDAMTGGDAEIGYEITKRITAYAGGYCFREKNVGSKYGPKARLTFDWYAADRRILGIFDKFALETEIRRDKPTGTVWSLTANIRIGYLINNKTVLDDVSRHMVDLLRRDPDIVTTIYEQREQPFKNDYSQITAPKLGATPTSGTEPTRLVIKTIPPDFSQINEIANNTDWIN